LDEGETAHRNFLRERKSAWFDDHF
jgi:hypothetical protein